MIIGPRRCAELCALSGFILLFLIALPFSFDCFSYFHSMPFCYLLLKVSLSIRCTVTPERRRRQNGADESRPRLRSLHAGCVWARIRQDAACQCRQNGRIYCEYFENEKRLKMSIFGFLSPLCELFKTANDVNRGQIGVKKK